MLKSKENTLRIEGIVKECLPGNKYRIRLDDTKVVLGYLSGKMIKNHIRLIPDDNVIIELNPLDLTKGRVVFRK